MFPLFFYIFLIFKILLDKTTRLYFASRKLLQTSTCVSFGTTIYAPSFLFIIIFDNIRKAPKVLKLCHLLAYYFV